MKKKPPKQNRHCPVPGCQTSAPHTDDETVKGLVHALSGPAEIAHWTMASILELWRSMDADLAAGRNFALISRSRQVEELYIRALYAIFIATPTELAHILSDAMPNSFRAMYKKVNALVFEGKGILEVAQPGLKSGTFTPMDTINRGAHGSFSTMMMVIGLARHPEYLEPYTSGRYFTHVSVYLNYLNYLKQMFEGGQGKDSALAGLINMHRPKSSWEANAKEGKDNAKKQEATQEAESRQGTDETEVSPK